MPVTVKEIRRSKGHTSSGSPSARREYVAWGSAVGSEIETAVDLVAPATVSTMPIESASFEPREQDETVWDCIYNYATTTVRPTPATGTEEISFDLGSQTVKVTQSLQTLNRYSPAGKPLVDFKGGIGYDGEKFTGADRFIETFSFSITRYVARSTVEAGTGFITNLRNCAFHFNNAQFRGFAAGEVLFIGASGSKRSETDYAVTYKFVVGKNATGLIAGDITGIAKNAWDYLWILYEDVEDTAGKFITPRPRCAFVESLYTSANFPSLLGVAA